MTVTTTRDHEASTGDGSAVAEAVRRLCTWVDGLREADVPPAVDAGLDEVLENLLAVTVGGASTRDVQRLTDAWAPEQGPVPLLGTSRSVGVEAAAWLGGVAAVAMERDEGHREVGGHPASQAFPAVLALGAARRCSGPELRRALLVAYEVAARVGAATALDPGVHPHGTFGVAGAAAGCGVLLGLGHRQLVSAVLAGLAMPLATTWGPVLAGGAVRDQWVGAGNLNGLAAARFAAAGAPAEHVTCLGSVGTIDASVLDADLGGRWYVTTGYLKRHSACAFTHGAADAALELRHGLVTDGRAPERVRRVEVQVTGTARELTATRWTTRHGAYFSVPFAVASALVHGDLAHARSDPDVADAALAAVAGRVEVVDGSDLPLTVPGARPARVTVHLEDGTRRTAHVPHPRGDRVLTPFDPAEREALLHEALVPSGGRFTAADVQAVVAALPTARTVAPLLARLTTPPRTTEMHT